MNIHIPFDRLTKAQQLYLYFDTRQPVLDENAIFSDATKNFRIPSEPDVKESTKVRIRTAKDNIDEVFLCFVDTRIPLSIEYSDELFDYYYGIIPPTSTEVEYFFELNVGNLKCYYNKKGISREPDSFYNFKIIPGFKTPDWAKGAIMYQIFVDRFYNGDKNNDVVDNEYMYVGKPSQRVIDWNKLPNADGIREFYGGDLQGVIDKLDYLDSLGIEVIYLNPIFVSPSNHKYDTQDYDNVDPHYGKIINDGGEAFHDKFDNNYATKYIKRTTDKENLNASNEVFQQLVEKAHEKNIKVILDGVFNHCGSFNKWLDREKIYENSKKYDVGAYSSNDSPYSSFFHFHDKNGWPNNPHYDGWWGYDTLPKLNYEGSPKLYNYILDVGRKWVSPPYNADGWRLDVAADLGYTKEFNHQFWRDFRKAVKDANKDTLIISEHYGDPSDWIKNGDQWDTVMNYDAFMEPVTWFLTGMEKHSDEFRGDLLGNSKAFFDAMIHNMSRFHIQSLQVAMNELSNHDHSRFLTRTNHKVGRLHTLGAEAANGDINKGIMKEAVAIQMTWPGAPTIYYGDEVGLCGWTDPDNRRSFPWGNEDEDLLLLHKELITIRKSYDALKYGSIKFLYGEHMVISYGRWDDKDKIVVVINNSREEKSLNIPVWQIGVLNVDIMEQLIETYNEGYSTEGKPHKVINGKIKLKMNPFSAIVMKKI
jgi:alpha-glucosidase